MWVFRRGDPERPVLLYQYHPTRAGTIAAAFPGEFQGLVQTEGYSGYDFLNRRKAITYALNQWDPFNGYLADGRLSPDNNAAENAIRPFVIGRKDWLFGGTPEGAAASALFYSLIETPRPTSLSPMPI